MSAADAVAISVAPWYAFLRAELALQPGRLATMVRITICCTVTVILCMVFRIPVPAYAAYIVFLASGLETATTLTTAIGGVIAITAAVCLSLLIYLVDAGEPALRLPLMAAATFLGMYLSRVIVIGPIAFLIGFLLVITQTLIDDIPHLDALTEFVMWLWVVVMIPAGLVSILDIAFGQSPAQLLRRKVLGVFDEVENSLRTGKTEQLARCLTVTAALPELRQRAELVDSGLKAIHAIDLALIEGLDELVRVVSLLPPGPSSVRAALLVASRACRDALSNRLTPSILVTPIVDDIVRGLDPRSRPVVLAAASILDRLLGGLAQRAGDIQGAPSAKREAKAFFVPDAFSNPEHVRFALKATLATMLVYITYSGLDWSGIRTCVVTCFFVALSSVGETVHKLTLRLGGAMAGGLLGVLCIVFVLPHVTTIGGLSLVTACVAIFSAWISTSSERLAYFGMQMAFAFFLGVLQGYGPTEELTVLRDRVIGIVFGNIMMSIVFVTVWPVSAVDQAQAALTKALAALGGLLRKPVDGARLAVAQTLHRARRLLSISEFEGGLFAGHSHRRQRVRERLADLDALTAATFVVIDQREQSTSEKEWREAAASWFENPHAPAAPVPADDSVVASLAALQPEARIPLQAVLESNLLLSATMRSAAAHAS
jgi:multidrug resistance protein MdtO